jgi:hypothetical protein
LWFNYENVNGLDFWNNSFAIPADKKKGYGRIRVDSILEARSGLPAMLGYSASWLDFEGHRLLREVTHFHFYSYPHLTIVDRTTELEALEDVHFADAKDGLLGLRVAHELELPTRDTRQFRDEKGNITTVSGNNGDAVTGNYVTSEGKQGDSAWGTRGSWCLLYGKMHEDSISILIIDHPENPGYPTYWHARGYGLFAANPLGQEIFSKGKHRLDFSLDKGRTAIFRYRIVVASGSTRLPAERIAVLAKEFAAARH